MKKQREDKKEIFAKVEQFYKKYISYTRIPFKSTPKEEFIPGKTLIRQADCVYDEKEMINLVDVALDFWLTVGKYAGKFEKGLAKFLGVKHCLVTNSGSSANLAAVSALTSPKLGNKRLKPGDEVITVACGFPTTLNPILQNNLTPVFVDVELGTYNIDVSKIEKAISKKTKAIFVAHTLGNPIEINRILRIVKKYNLWFVEDNCDALGSKYKDKYTGSFSHLSTCSFYPAHHITMGEGGAVLTNDLFLKRIVSSFCSWGRDCWCAPGEISRCGKRFSWQLGKLPFGYDHKYIFSHIGYNLKVTEMQAAIGVAQLKKLSRFVRLRKRNFAYLYRQLKKYEDFFVLPQVAKNADPSWFGFPLLVRKKASFTRADIVNYLEKYKIATRMLFGGNLLKQPAYQEMKYRLCGSLKNTDLVMNNLFWFGVHPGIDKVRCDFIIKKIAEFLNTPKGEKFRNE